MNRQSNLHLLLKTLQNLSLMDLLSSEVTIQTRTLAFWPNTLLPKAQNVQSLVAQKPLTVISKMNTSKYLLDLIPLQRFILRLLEIFVPMPYHPESTTTLSDSWGVQLPISHWSVPSELELIVFWLEKRSSRSSGLFMMLQDMSLISCAPELLRERTMV